MDLLEAVETLGERPAIRPLLLGEANPYGGSPRRALWPYPKNAAGNRLREILGLTTEDYLAKFDRRNLCPRSWNLEEAKRVAGEIESSRDFPIVLLGARVCRAFNLGFNPFTKCLMEVYILPHPSGLCRIWNDPTSHQRARDLLKEFL